jgi:hypothetical protein
MYLALPVELRCRGPVCTAEGSALLVDRIVTSDEIVAAFKRLRSLWKRLYDGAPSAEARENILKELAEDLDAVTAAARVSEEGRRFVEVAILVRMDAWRPSGSAGSGPAAKDTGDADRRATAPGALPGAGAAPGEEPPAGEALMEAADGVRSGFEMRLRTLRQMEAGDDVLPDSGRELRRSAARDLVFFRKLRDLDRGREAATDEEAHDPQTADADELERLIQSFDPRRKVVREEIDLPTPATEAIEFLVRLGAG